MESDEAMLIQGSDPKESYLFDGKQSALIPSKEMSEF